MSPRTLTNLEKVLAAGHFVLTTEVGPPQNPNPEPVRKKAAILKGLADTYNVTDNQTAVVRMSSHRHRQDLSGRGSGEMTCRDCSRIACSRICWALRPWGSRTSGHQQRSPESQRGAGKLKGHPGAKNVYDVDSMQLISIIKGLRDEARQQGGTP